MTNAAMGAARPLQSGHCVVRLLPGEGLWQAKRRWQKTTGYRGIVLIR